MPNPNEIPVPGAYGGIKPQPRDDYPPGWSAAHNLTSTRPTESVPEMRRWVNGATATEEDARRVWSDIQAKDHAEQVRKLDKMFRAKATGCPNCGYPDTKDGKHGRPANYAYFARLGSFFSSYRKEKELAEQDTARGSRGLPVEPPLTPLQVVELRRRYTEGALSPTGHHVGDLLAVWRLLATIDSLMAEKETV